MIFVIHDPIYAQKVTVAIAEPREEPILRAVRKAGYPIAEEAALSEMLALNGADARTVMDVTGAVIIRLSRLRRGNVSDLGTLAHECVHAGVMLFHRISAPIKFKTDEPFAYYVSFLVQAILEGANARR